MTATRMNTPAVINTTTVAGSGSSSSNSFSTSTATANMMIHRDQHQIRNHFLNTLGIVRPVVDQHHGEQTDDDDDDHPERRQSQHEALKYDHGDDDDDDASMTDALTTSANKPTASASSSRRRLVSFRPSVQVRTIPSHREYSKDIRETLWNGTVAVSEIVRRNTREYTTEGWTMEGVLEEDNFVRLPSGDLVHPTTHQFEQQQTQRLQEEQQKRKKTKSYAYKSVAQCLSFGIPPQRLSKKTKKKKSSSSTTISRRTTSRGVSASRIVAAIQ